MPGAPSQQHLSWPSGGRPNCIFTGLSTWDQHRDTAWGVTTMTRPVLILDNKQNAFLSPTWYAHKQPGTKTQGLACAWEQKPAVAVHTALPRKKCSTAWTSFPWSRLEVWHTQSHQRRCCRPRTCVNHTRGHLQQQAIMSNGDLSCSYMVARTVVTGTNHTLA